ncbi:MAG: 30S ribosomal protein S16P [uncultured bacterium (gcode 4)]|uniref:Small ribosomal subunit protein bS16 n=1 Tax=uncultured bacterium (gcode 4) TaxID=1234023 RepID=K2F7V2_9BACT|nr:MAG: 30S ribosomal protein S16P [uncultured bacterium (gcode 4)]
MLKIRLSRAGRKNLPFYRIVLTEAKKAPQHGYQKVLGFYNPITKELKIDSDEAQKHISNWAQYSDSLKKILERNK